MTDTPSESLGSYLDGQRRQAGYGLRELARITDTSVSKMNRLLNDEISRPSPVTLGLIADALNLSLVRLFTLSGYPYPDVDDLLRTDHGLSDEEISEFKGRLSGPSAPETRY